MAHPRERAGRRATLLNLIKPTKAASITSQSSRERRAGKEQKGDAALHPSVRPFADNCDERGKSEPGGEGVRSRNRTDSMARWELSCSRFLSCQRSVAQSAGRTRGTAIVGRQAIKRKGSQFLFSTSMCEKVRHFALTKSRACWSY